MKTLDSDMQPISDETLSQFQILHDTKIYLLFIIAALFFSFISTIVSEKQLLCEASNTSCDNLPDICLFRLPASLLVTISLVYFYLLAENTKNNPSDDCQVNFLSDLNYIASILVLIAGFLRLYSTAKACL